MWVGEWCIYISHLGKKKLNAKILSLQDFSTQKYSLPVSAKISVVMAMAMLLGLDASTHVAMGRAGSTTFGALGENFKWGLFIIKY